MANHGGELRLRMLRVNRIRVTTLVQAPIDRCFDLARDVDVHIRAAAFASERVVPPGRIHGCLEAGDLVTFEGLHLGLRMRLTVRVVEMARPGRFVDEGVGGRFRSFRHTHEFRETNGTTEITDTLEWISPLGMIGRMVDRVLLRRHLRWFIEHKQRALKAMAEEPDRPLASDDDAPFDRQSV